MKQRAACIFDLDGTLVNSLVSIAHFANAALVGCGHRALPVETYRYLVGNGADALMRGALAASMGPGRYTEEDVFSLRQSYDRLYEEDPLQELGEYPGVLEMVQELKKGGFRLAVLSNKPHTAAEAVVRLFFPAGIFEAVYGQQYGVPRKPSPEGALLIAGELGVSPENCYYIGDSDVDMQTGRAAGMKTVGVLWGFRDRAELENNGASFIAESPKELLRFIRGEEGRR